MSDRPPGPWRVEVAGWPGSIRCSDCGQGLAPHEDGIRLETDDSETAAVVLHVDCAWKLADRLQKLIFEHLRSEAARAPAPGARRPHRRSNGAR